MKNLTLFLGLFFCEAIPAFIITHYIYKDYAIDLFVLFLLTISLIFSWFFADKNKKIIKNIGYIGMLIGIAFSVSYFTDYESSTGILIVALSMMIGVNISLRERRMLAYLLIFSFMLFLYASSLVFNEYSIVSVVLFTFSFFMVVIADYYNTRVRLQTHYNAVATGTNNFFGTVLLLVVVVSMFTAVLYYLLPQPKALHYGILPFGGAKQYKGFVGESNIKNRHHKENTTQLPQYDISGKRIKPNGNFLIFDNKTNKVNNRYKAKQNNIIEERNLKIKNKKAYYSSLYTNSSEHNNSNNILFEVKGKEARFLRGHTYALFNGKGWKKILTKMYTIQKGSVNFYSYWDGKKWQRRMHSFKHNNFYYNEYFTKKSDNYTITVKGKLAGKPVIYTPVGLLSLQFPTDTFYEDAARTIYAPSQLAIGTYYTASVEREKYYGYDAMSYADVWYKRAYSQPNPNIKIKQLAKKLINHWDSSLEKAQAIVKYFKTNYLYKHASIKNSIQNQTLSEMLFKTKVGNALQFNTALIMMLRSSGEYARLVTGYAPSEYNQTSHSYIVERKNKAVWTELFVKDRGWIDIHAADDIPFEGEIVDKVTSEVFLSKTQLIFLSMVFFSLSIIFLYYIRKYIWTYQAKSHISKYVQKSDIDFVIATYKEVERYYSHFQKGKKSSFTLQEYASYIKRLKPENSYLIEYLSLYSNQAIYKGEVDADFDKERYLDVALYLVDNSFKIESFDSYVARKVLKHKSTNKGIL
ncbi:transglutaminase-like domain-containing protein [Sulfurimonas sp.]